MKRERKGWPANSEGARKGFTHANTITRALDAARPAAVSDVALNYWRERLWQAADSVGLKLTDDQLETMAADLVVAAKKAPDDE